MLDKETLKRLPSIPVLEGVKEEQITSKGINVRELYYSAIKK